MNHVFMLREFDPRISKQDFLQLALESLDCMPLYNVSWNESLLANNGQYLLCHFNAPDSEAIRMLTRTQQSLHKHVFHGSYHPGKPQLTATVIVERLFTEPADFNQLQAQEESHQGCLDTYDVSFVASFFSHDRQRMVCLYQAPDAEAVRRAQQEAGMPVHKIWACQHFNPENFAP